MRRSYIAGLVAAGLIMIGCSSAPGETPEGWGEPDNNRAAAPYTPPPAAVPSDLVELRQERAYLVELKFKKEELTLDPGKLWANEQNAQTVTIPVGAETYNQWQEGQEISTAGGAANFWLKGEISHYAVKVNKKSLDQRYVYADAAGGTHEVSQADFNAWVNNLQSSSLPVTAVETTNGTSVYVLKVPLDQVKLTSVTPYMRYYLTVEISNQSFTTDLDKQLRNALSKQQLTLEVPESAFRQPGDLWDPHLNTAAFLLKGHLTQMRGTVIKRWEQPDSNFSSVVTADGQKMVLPNNEVPK